LAAAGKPAILVPYPHAVDDHQTVNAGYLEKAGAALICQQTDFSVAWLTDTLQQLIASPETLADMAIASQACAVLDATEQTLEQIERIYREC
jgi:UDP-N-acetylglucosamine--N-acetylmuramyl-(pentapeptide) pyrophosphoryl-undecaprenol N-acetylglucosamine transferase